MAEDEIIARLILEEALAQLGHEYMGARDGLEAWELFQTCEIDVIISDWRMPKIDGPELCMRVRSGNNGPRYTPFIFVTALDDKRYALEAMEAGADDYLVKPLDIDDLRGRLIVAQRLKWVEDERRRLLQVEHRARAEAEAAVRLSDDVLAAISHDLRTPLTAILGSAQLLQWQLSTLELGSDLEALVGSAERIKSAAIHMDKWIDDLVDVARLRIGVPVIVHPGTINLVDQVQRAVDEHQSTTSRHQIALRTEHTSVMGKWDEARLRRALDNLLSNAIKYSPSGGAITVTLEEFVTAEGATVVLRVQDEGLGIPAGDLGNVFSRYQRAGNVGRIAGQGIGLAGVRQIIEEHGGTVSVQSREGVGSTFTMRLPVV